MSTNNFLLNLKKCVHWNSSTTKFFIEVVATVGCKIWNSNLIGYLVSIYLASFRWKELRKENKKKVSFCRTLLLACWNRFYTQFDMLLSKKHRQSWDYHLVLAKLPPFFAEQVEMQVYIIYAIFCTPKQLIHTDCKHTKNQDSL